MRNSRVLIIDDSITIRAMVEELLATQAQCHEIAMAPDVPTARALMASFRPTIITLDLNMPGMNGLDLLDELRGYPHAPVVVVSSASTQGSDTANEAISHGAHACFDKSKIISESKLFIRTLKKASVVKLRRTKGLQPVERARSLALVEMGDLVAWIADQRCRRAPILSRRGEIRRTSGSANDRRKPPSP